MEFDKYQQLMDLLTKVYQETILTKKLLYKTKNQMRHYKQYHYIEELVKFMIRNILQGFQLRKVQTSK